jgi:hypothetical protein
VRGRVAVLVVAVGCRAIGERRMAAQLLQQLGLDVSELLALDALAPTKALFGEAA